MWECDGCSFLGTEEEVEQHVLEANKGLTLEDYPQNVKCHGAMKVFGRAWIDFYAYGVHPMQTLTGMLLPLYQQYARDIATQN